MRDCVAPIVAELEALHSSGLTICEQCVPIRILYCMDAKAMGQALHGLPGFNQNRPSCCFCHDIKDHYPLGSLPGERQYRTVPEGSILPPGKLVKDIAKPDILHLSKMGESREEEPL
jgi:hypothetical protein